jgi:hypothetical protein
MADIVIREAAGKDDIATVRRLMQAYGEYLGNHPGGAANICLEGYARELESLPSGYIVLLLAFVDGIAAGCVALRQIDREERACEMKRLWVDSEFRGLRLGACWSKPRLPGRNAKGSRRCISIPFLPPCPKQIVSIRPWGLCRSSDTTKIHSPTSCSSAETSRRSPERVDRSPFLPHHTNNHQLTTFHHPFTTNSPAKNHPQNA